MELTKKQALWAIVVVAFLVVLPSYAANLGIWADNDIVAVVQHIDAAAADLIADGATDQTVERRHRPDGRRIAVNQRHGTGLSVPFRRVNVVFL